MYTVSLLSILALASVALAASLKPEEILKEAAIPGNDYEFLRKTGVSFEVLGKLLQEKELSADTSEKLADVVGALQVLRSLEDGQNEATSEYFWKKIRRAVENVAKVVVVNKAVGAVAGALG